jgi:hypothetical protein
MFRKCFLSVAIVGILTARVVAVPLLTMVPLGLEAGNYAWRLDITPDLVLAGGSTPLAVELGFRLTGSPLLSATNINPSGWDTPNPGSVIFGWETLTDVDSGPGVNLKPEGLQSNTSTSEVFAAYGSAEFTTPGAKPFLKFLALGPANGGSNSSTIQWLGHYGVAGANGRIAQETGPTSAQNFDIYSGFATQIPEPVSATLLALGALVAASFTNRVRR